MPRRHRRPDAGDRGSAAAELAIAAPLLLFLLILIAVANHAVTARHDIDSAAAAAARAATLQRDPTTAAAAAHAELDARATTCSRLAVDIDTSGFTPGGQVTVTLTCHIDNQQLAAGLPLPAVTTLTATATSPIDVWRGQP